MLHHSCLREYLDTENRHLCHEGRMATGLIVGAYAARSPDDGAATIVAAWVPGGSQT